MKYEPEYAYQVDVDLFRGWRHVLLMRRWADTNARNRHRYSHGHYVSTFEFDDYAQAFKFVLEWKNYLNVTD